MIRLTICGARRSVASPGPSAATRRSSARRATARFSVTPGTWVAIAKPLEAGFWRLVKGADLPLPIVQRLVRSADGARVTTADFAWGENILVFVDGYRWHGSDTAQAEQDQRRRSTLAEEGRLVLEFAYEDIVSDREGTVAAIRALIQGERAEWKRDGGSIVVAGTEVPAISVDEEAMIVTVAAPVGQWQASRAGWRRALAGHRLLARAGFAVRREVT